MRKTPREVAAPVVQATAHSRFRVMVSAATPSASCWGNYGNVAVVECEPNAPTPKMISTHARGVVRIIDHKRNLHVGAGVSSAFVRALNEAKEKAEKLNGAV